MQQLLVLYDGYCNLCHWSVRWLSRGKGKSRFLLMPQHSYSELKQYDKAVADSLKERDEIVVINKGVLYSGAAAIMEVLHTLGGGYRLIVYLLRIFPMRWLDGLYALVARLRYSLFGRRATCQIN